jgi:hypothetical protein
VYPHKRAVELAKETNRNVLSMSHDMSKNMAAGAKTGDDPSVRAMENTEVSRVNPQGDRVDRPKNGKPRDVPMGDLAGRLRTRLTGNPDAFVFRVETKPRWCRERAICRTIGTFTRISCGPSPRNSGSTGRVLAFTPFGGRV